MAEWYYERNGQQFGPVPSSELKRLAAQGRLAPSDLIWREGMAQWLPASRTRGLFPEPAMAHASGGAATAAYPAAAPAVAAAPAEQTYACATCGGLFGVDQVYNDHGSIICRRCYAARPVFPQQVAGAAALGYYGPRPGTVAYAGFWLRFVAAIVDGLILMVGSFIVGLIVDFMLAVAGGVVDDPAIELFMNLVGIGIAWLYFALMESSPVQATLGKMAVGIKVTDMGGGRITFARATGRHFGKYISGVILCIGYLMAAFTERKQALHDMMASALVVRKSA